MAYVSGFDNQQLTLEPFSYDQLVSADNICRVIAAFVDTIDIKDIGFKYCETAATGRRPYNPADMLKLYIYGYLNRVRSSRRLEKECERNIEVMWLLNGLKPDARTICNFRSDNRQSFKKIFQLFLRKCKELALIGGKVAAIDGTKIKADNGRKNCHTEKGTKATLARLDAKISEYMKELDKNDASENDDSKDGEVRVDESKIKEALASLTSLKEKKEKFTQYQKQIKDNDGQAICTVDPQAKLMKQGNGKGFDVCYNLQTAVDSKEGLIVAFELTDSCNDLNELSHMALEAKEAVGADELTVTADKGYSNGAEIHKCEEAHIHCLIPMPEPSYQPKNEKYHRKNFIYNAESDTYTCPCGNILKRVRERKSDGHVVYANRSACMNCPMKAECTKSKTLREIERALYASDTEAAAKRAKADPALFARRQELSEHPFGIIKSIWGFGQFLCRGKEKTSAESALAVLAFNMRRVINIFNSKDKGQGISALIARLT
jgi:transposase